jgi:hypothetical protein
MRGHNKCKNSFLIFKQKFNIFLIPVKEIFFYKELNYTINQTYAWNIYIFDVCPLHNGNKYLASRYNNVGPVLVYAQNIDAVL